MGQRHECPIYGHKSRWQGPILRCSSWEWTEPRQRWAAMMILRERADRYALNLAESPSLLREAAMKRSAILSTFALNTGSRPLIITGSLISGSPLASLG